MELGNIEKMDGISNLHPDIKVKGGIADRYVNLEMFIINSVTRKHPALLI